jgi:hypothetical protein
MKADLLNGNGMVVDVGTKYFYRPLAFFGGKVFKCEGICDASNIDKANEIFLVSDGAYIKGRGNVYLPGFIVIDGYRGDRIVIDGNNVAKEYKDGDKLPGREFCKVEVRNVYGNELIYPANFVAEKFALLAGKKTLSRADLGVIGELGFEVEEVATKKLAA